MLKKIQLFNDEDREVKATKNCAVKKRNFWDHKVCLKASQIIKTVNYFEKKIMSIVLKRINRNS